ncbi:hypothetical protein [Niallia sp. FSL W8-1348]|uniref:hypothetical protein n=1 Tax=Niallia sp. FSL W8-1348 TaxID=2954656 RepID=UPI0030FBE4B3
MIIGTKLGKSWVVYLFLTYILIYSIGTKVIEIGLGKIGFAAIPYVRALIVASTLFGIFMFMLIKFINRNFEIPKKDLIIVSLILYYIILTACIGLYLGNSLLYILSDMAYVILGLMIYIVTRIGKVYIEINMNTLNKIMLITGLCLLIVKFMGVNSLLVSIFFIHAALLTYAVFIFSFKSILINIIPLLVLLPSLNRTAFLTLIILIGFTTFLMLLKGKVKQAFIIIFITSFVILFASIGFSYVINNLVQISQWEFMSTPLGRRIYNTLIVFADNSVSKDISIQQRLFEVKAVLDSLGNNPLKWIFGVGLGGTLDMSTSLDTSVQSAALLGEADVHNVHILPAATVFRFGLVGLLVVTAIFFNIIKTLFKTKDPTAFVFAFAGFAIIIFSLSASSFMITEPILWLSLAVIKNTMYRNTAPL